MFALKLLAAQLGVANIDCRQDGTTLDPAYGRASYIFNTTIAGIEEADAILLVGANPRLEAPVLNARIRKRWRHGQAAGRRDRRAGRPDLRATTISAPEPRPWPRSRPARTLRRGAEGREEAADHRRAGRSGPRGRRGHSLARRQGGRSPSARSRTAGTASACCTPPPRASARSISASCRARAALDAAAMATPGALDVLFLLGADEIEVAGRGAFVVYLGTHGDRGAHRADVILPGAAYTEKSGTYVNTEGRVQLANRAGFPPGDAREDWAILRALSERSAQGCPSTSLAAAARQQLYADHPHFAAIDYGRGRRRGGASTRWQDSAGETDPARRSARRWTTST